MSDTEYTIISVPWRSNGEQQRQAQFNALQGVLGPLASSTRLFLIPNLKVGTLDTLLEASDELSKLDPQLEGSCFKLASILEELSGLPRTSVTKLSISPQSQELSAEQYMKDFSWNPAQYDVKETLMNLVHKLAHVVSSAEDRTRGLLVEYNETKTKVQQANRKTSGNLAVRPIDDDVKAWCRKQNIPEPIDSEFLTTLFVAVPKADQPEWQASYPRLHEFVVPRSSTVVAVDNDYYLNSVVCFKKVADDIKIEARKKKYVVRDHHMNEDDIGSSELASLEAKLKTDKDKLTVLLKQQFTLSFVAWMHAKAVRVFVESMLRFGLPPKFVPIMLALDAKKTELVKEKLKQLYADFGSEFQKEEGGVGMSSDASLEQDLPYVSLKVANIAKH